MNTTEAMMESIEMNEPADSTATETSAIDTSAPEAIDTGYSPPPPPPTSPSPAPNDGFPPPVPNGPPTESRVRWWKRPVSRIPNGKHGGKLGGVVAGMADAYGFDVGTSRIAVVVAPFVLPIIPMLYMALWILLPRSPAEAVPLDSIIRDRRRTPLVVILALLLVASGVGSFGSWFAFGGFPWGLALVGIGVLLWVSPELVGSSGTHPVSAADSSAQSTAASARVAGWSPSTGQAIGSVPSLVPSRRRRPIGLIGLGIAVVFVAAASALDGLDARHPAVLTTSVVAISIIIAGLASSAIINRSFREVPLLGIMCAALVFVSVARPNLDGGFGERTVAVAAGAATRSEHLGAGRLRIDLSTSTAAAVHVDAEVGFGRLEVVVPDDATIRLRTNVGMGGVQIDDRLIVSGVRNVDEREIAATVPVSTGAARTIDLDLRVGAGEIAIVHAG